MTTGRTSPALMGCSVAGTDQQDEFVVKLQGALETNTSGLVCEAIAASLADYFGIGHPGQALIELDDSLAVLIAEQEPDKGSIIKNSIGINFGTRMLRNLVTWPVDRKPSASQLRSAWEIFAFDVLIQNPDRRFNNPNLGSVGETLTIFDHELAFSFLLDIFENTTPWVVSRQTFWTQHVFFNALRHREMELDDFFAALARLPDDFVETAASGLPHEWTQDGLAGINTHLCSISLHAKEFRDELNRLLI